MRPFKPVDIASLVAYRVLFGLLVAWSLGRLWWNGWIETMFLQPKFFFPYMGLEWITVPAAPVLFGLFALGILAALFVAAGAFYRVSSAILFLVFTYVELMDKANYLNHYYLVSLLAGLNLFLPLHRQWSLDTLWGLAKKTDEVPAWCLYLVRFQIACVYFYAGMAKVGTDWLLHAQPLKLWMSSQVDIPLLGRWLSHPLAPYLMSWAGFLFDTFVWMFLLWPRTRALAYPVVLVFHFFTWLFFPIGLFPFIMVTCATIFFSPSWPRRWLGVAPARRSASTESFRLAPWAYAIAGLYIALQVGLPLRHFLYPGDLLWTEQGVRFSWRVMARDKNGSVVFVVRDRKSGRKWEVSPSRYLARHQEMEMSGQPDMILQLAHHIAGEFASRGHDVEVHADAWLSLNGRPAQRFIDPKQDLTQVRDSLLPFPWILPSPRELAPTHVSRSFP